MWREDFDPETIRIMTEAFDLAWGFLTASPRPLFEDEGLARELLARKIFVLVRDGEMNRTQLANMAIAYLRQREQSRQSQERIMRRPFAKAS